MARSRFRLIPVLFLFLFPSVTQGTIVTTTSDEDDGSLGGGSGISLREAVRYSSAGSTIAFTPALSGGIIRLTLGQITIANSLTINGSALPVKITLCGDKTGDGSTADDTRVIDITAGTVLLDSLLITGGNCPAGTPTTQGAGIHVSSSTTQLTIRDSTLSGNSATDGAAIYFFGELNNPNFFLRIENSTLVNNSATGEAGAIRIFGRLFIFNSIFSGNSARQGGAIYSRDGIFQIGNSFFSGNSATSEGGAILCYRATTLTSSTFAGNSAPYGGAIFSSFNCDLTVENSTITANTARNSGGGIFVSGASTTLRHSTLTGNAALESGGGIWRKSSGSTPVGILAANNSIISNNSAPNTPNIDSGGTFTGANNLISGVPHLATLGDYGGPTRTMPPLPGSPAINAGSATTLTTDQRGFTRTGLPDSGAAEYRGNLDLARYWKMDFDGDGLLYGTEQALGSDPLVSDPTTIHNLTTPALNPAGHAVMSFGIGAAAPGTRWILTRSTDLLTFTEIYRYNGTADTAVTGITFLRTATRITVTDTTSPPGGSYFYRFEAMFDP